MTWVGLTSFGEFLWLVGRYYSYLLPKQNGGTFQIKSRSTQPSSDILAHAAEQTEVDDEEEDAILEEEQNQMYLDNLQAEFD